MPLALLDAAWRGDGKVIVLEPRRLATRAAARRMAQLAGGAPGDLVGYQTRDERVIGPATRIEVLTEGVLTRRLQHDPELPGVAAVLFDEVHERNLTTDLGLALTLDVGSTLRPDLRIVAMSATADTATFARLLATDTGPAPVVVSEGRTHPIDLRWLPRQRNDRVEAAVASAVERALDDELGDVLVFLPGIGEITRVRERLVASLPAHVDVRPLAGALSLEDQDLALAPSPPGRRRVVLATDIAETSLTVEGVRIVVDSGLARSPRFDTGTGMTRLTTVSISRDSADQRAGRAGRTEPGVAYRLWSKIEHGSRLAHRPAEIESVDLAGLALELAAWGTTPDRLSFADPPPARAWRQGLELLAMLGAIDPDGRLTDVGRMMVNLPLHPRLARIVAGAPLSAACVVAAVVDERDVIRGHGDELPADLALRVAVVCGHTTRRPGGPGRCPPGAGPGGRPGAPHRHPVRPRLGRSRPHRAAAHGRLSRPTGGPPTAGPVPDAHRLRGVGGRRAIRSPRADFLVAADVDGKRSGARIRLGAAVEAFEIAGVLDDVVEDRRLVWDADRDDLVVRIERRLDALRLGEEVRAPEPGDDTVDALVVRIAQHQARRAVVAGAGRAAARTRRTAPRHVR